MVYYLWADSADFNNVQFGFGADHIANWDRRGIPTTFDNIQNRVGLFVYDTVWSPSANKLAVFETFALFLHNSTYLMQIVIYPDSAGTHYYPFFTTGSGKFDIWSSPCQTFTSMLMRPNDYIPTTIEFPEIVKFKVADSLKTVFSSFISSPSTITVGNYVNKNEYYNVNGDFVQLALTPQALGATSSKGPARDGRIKPDITATGEVIFSVGTVTKLSGFLASDPDKLALGGMHYKNGGTSMSSPTVAGVIALYMQKVFETESRMPGWQEVMDCMRSTAKQDAFTGAVPNDNWGSGKIDAYALLNCVYDTSGPDTAVTVNELNPPGASLIVYPNPFTGTTQFVYDLGQGSVNGASIQVTNLLGQLIDKLDVTQSRGRIQYSSRLAPGIYACFLENDGVRHQVQKLIVY